MKKEVTIDTTEIQRIIWVYYKQLYNLQNGETRINAQILRKVQTSKTESGRNTRYGQTNHKYWNWNCDLKTSNKQKTQDQMTSQANSIKHLEKT